MSIAVASAVSSSIDAALASELETLSHVTLVRRCTDRVELLALAASGGMSVAAVSQDFPGMDATVVSELKASGVAVVLVAPTSTAIDRKLMAAWGISHSHVVGVEDLEPLLEQLHAVGRGPVRRSDMARSVGVSGKSHRLAGRVVAVWGAHGAPGRTTVAAHLAQALIADGPVLLIDADTTAPSVSAYFGIATEVSGLLALARRVDVGELDEECLAQHTIPVEPGFDVLTGIGRSPRWSELAPHHLDRIVALAARAYRWIVIDVSAEASPEETLAGTVPGAGRHCATRTVLRGADAVVAVVAADALSIQRFLTQVTDVKELVETLHVVATKVRPGRLGGSGTEAIRATLHRFAGVSPTVYLPWAAAALDRASLRAQQPTALAMDVDYATAFAGVVSVVKGESGQIRRIRHRPRRLSLLRRALPPL